MEAHSLKQKDTSDWIVLQSAIKDSLKRPLLVIWARLSCLKKVDPLLEHLTRTKNHINQLLRHLEVIKR